MKLGRQSICSVAQLLASLSTDAVDILLFKHLNLRTSYFALGTGGYLDALAQADDDAISQLIGELIRENSAIRADASTKHVFDGRWREVERWLLHDGLAIEDGELVRIAAEAEEATGIREKLFEDLHASGLDNDGAIRKCIEDSATNFVKEPSDFNNSVTKVRIALETTARRAATEFASSGGPPYPKDSWGKALEYLRTCEVLEPQEEDILARVYKFISPGTHIPAGVTEEEWARLARTFGLSSCYFLLKKYRKS